MAQQSKSSRIGRRVLRSYRGPLTAALPLGFTLGALAGLVLWLNVLETGNGPSLSYLLGLGGGIGAGLSAVAALGATAAVITRRIGETAEATPLARIGLGATAAVALSVLLTGTAIATVDDSWQWYWITCWIATIAGLASGVSATAVTTFFRYRPRSRQPRPAP